jgi:hypothetical protein
MKAWKGERGFAGRIAISHMDRRKTKREEKGVNYIIYLLNCIVF